MGHATLWPVPRAIDAEAHHYPRYWKRNLFLLYGGMLLINVQIQRYGWICRVSNFCLRIYFAFSNPPSKMENTWTGEATMHQRKSDMIDVICFYLKLKNLIISFLFVNN